MAQPEAIQNGSTIIAPHPTCMESVNRISKLPVVESTIQTATNIYEKVKDYNSVTNWTITTAEGAVQKAVEVGKPVATPIIQNLGGPIKKVDAVLCSGLDYVESKVPAVKLPASELLLQIYANTKDYLNNTVSPTVESAMAYAEPAFKTAKDMVQPTVDIAMHAMEPTIEMAKHYVEPLVHPAMETVNNIKDNVMHRVEELLHREHNHQGDEIECADCQQIRDRLEQERRDKEQKEHQQEQPIPEQPQHEQPQPDQLQSEQQNSEVEEANAMEHE